MSETLIELQKEMRDNKGWKQGGAPHPFPFRCYACDEVGHRAFDCPTYPNFQYNYQYPRYQNKPKTRYTNQNYEKSDSTPGKVGVHKLSPDAGMFLKAKVNGIITDLLIDTGATVTVISAKMFQKMSNMPNLIPTERDIITANGDSLHVSGKTELEIETDKFKCTNTAIDADINVNCILGLDFLRTQEANINISKGTLTIKGHQVRFYVQGHIGCSRVAISETVNIPPRSEIVVNGAITDEVPDSFEVGLVEPTDDYKRTDKAIVGRALDAKSKNIPLRLMNLSSQIQTLYGGTIIAKVEYLGHIVAENGISTDPKKIEVVKNWPEPTTVTELRSFIGFCSYYRRFIKNFGSIAKPLHSLTQKGNIFAWTDECQWSFDKLKRFLTSAPVLAHPDFKQPFILDTDASAYSIGAVLSQIQNVHEKVIAFASRSLTKSERRYCVTRRCCWQLFVLHSTSNIICLAENSQ
ncbi:Retrovirus-related Pol polyprotein from transposon 412 [Mytilus coruscus]|uniref:Retrovirus-related Pol polyprotein from transposon 412 n=1 Tax=Mytilus coruscus TaxID=42192 RepID=A0A6J8AHI0_MYTCO|nr:Retrovirus-related Pol polyprotein from transposon 412 [Mytilus coruscus]